MIQRLSILLLLAFVAAGTPASAQETVTRLELTVEPSRSVRPFENVTVQVRVFGEAKDKDGSTKTGRLKRSGIELRVVNRDGGWVSKPFRYQGRDDGPFIGGNRFLDILGQVTVQDTFLYTAPERTGRYELQASLDGKTASTTIDVTTRAASNVPAERTSFPEAEATTNNVHRELASVYAPFIAQETWFTPKADYITRFDYDGDWQGDNNWDSLDRGTSQAYVYYTVMETSTHWFLIYNCFHPRDYSETCIAGTCHENDNEGLILTVEKDGSRFGRLQAMETLAHNNIYSYRADSRVRGNVHDIDGEVELYDRTHPVVFIESGGHGVYGSQSKQSRYVYRDDRFTAGTGVTFLYRGRAERPRHANDRQVGYELLPIYEQWWTRANSEVGRRDHTFDKYYSYQPFGNRPRGPNNQIAGAFYGRREADDKAKPFWGWEDKQTLKKKVLNVGQWGLDPAYAVSQNLRFPSETPFSLEYTYNPYLGITSRLEESPDDGGPVRGANRFDVRVYVRGPADVYVRGDEIWSSQRGSAFRLADRDSSQSIPLKTLPSMTIRQREGRGTARLVETPSSRNDYTARIRIEPDGSGEEYFFLRLKWEEFTR